VKIKQSPSHSQDPATPHDRNQILSLIMNRLWNLRSI